MFESIATTFSSWEDFQDALAKYNVKGNGKLRLRVYNKLLSLAKAGVPLSKALDSLYNLASKNGKNPSDPLALCMNSWRASVNNGETLGTAIYGWVPEEERMLIDAAGSSSIEMAVGNAATVLESGNAMTAAIKGGVTYPAFLFAGVGVVLWVFGVQVIPAFASVKPMSEWTGIAAQMAVVSHIVSNYSLHVVGGIVGVIGGMMYTLPWWTGPFRAKLDKNVPPWSFYRLAVGASFLLSLAALLKAGVPTTEALRKLRPAATPWLLERLDAITFHVNEGQTVGESMYLAGFQFPDEEVVEDLRLYATLGNFDERMDKLARQWIEEGVSNVQAQAAMLNMVALVAVGITVAWMGMGIMALQSQITSGL